MHDISTLVVSVFMGFFAIMNPIANTAVFVGLTSNQSPVERKKTALKALMTAFIMILAFSILGKAIFQLFGITLPALRLAGGILVFVVGYHMLQGTPSKMHSHQPKPKSESEPEENQSADVAISPLALPILAGPGTIATAMNYSASGSLLHIGVTIGAFACLCAITYVCFLYGPKIVEKIGESGIGIITRLMGLILTVIGMQMLIQGVHDAQQFFIK